MSEQIKKIELGYLDDGSKITLITRPRRFGKTLNLMMLKYWFERYDESLNLQNLKSEDLKIQRLQAPNSHLFHHLKIWKLGEEYTRHCGKYHVVYLSLKEVKDENWEECEKHFKKIIADEYERHESYFRGYYDKVIDFLRSFLGTGLKDNTNLQLCVIKGKKVKVN